MPATPPYVPPFTLQKKFSVRHQSSGVKQQPATLSQHIMMHTRLNKTLAIWIAGLWVAFFAGSSSFAQTAGNCGTLSSQGQFGPYDYRTERGLSLNLVEGAHFTPVVEALISGKTSNVPGPDIDYTLRAFPNHHRALMAMARLAELNKTPKPSGSHYTIECWFERAISFRPDDTTVRMIYSSYLNKNKRVPEAVAQLEQAAVFAKDNSFTHFNIGLVYFDMKIYDKALAQAHRAMALGFERTELRDLLEKAGQWREPAIAPSIATDLAPSGVDAQTPAEVPAANSASPPISAPTSAP